MEEATPCRQAPEQPQPGDTEGALIALAVEAWRFTNGIEHSLSRLDEAARKRATSQLRWLQRSIAHSLDTAGLRLVDVTAQRFDTGIAATPVNLDDFEPDDTLIIDRMLEPIIMGAAGVVHGGTVVLTKEEP